jgi:hypothetical protein
MPQSLPVILIIFFLSEFILLVVFSCYMSRSSPKSYHHDCLVVNDTTLDIWINRTVLS